MKVPANISVKQSLVFVFVFNEEWGGQFEHILIHMQWLIDNQFHSGIITWKKAIGTKSDEVSLGSYLPFCFSAYNLSLWNQLSLHQLNESTGVK